MPPSRGLNLMDWVLGECWIIDHATGGEDSEMSCVADIARQSRLIGLLQI